MHATSNLRLSPLILLLATVATPPALAESPLPDPIAPAVIGRPLDQLGPARKVPARKAVVAKAPVREAASRPAGSRPSSPRQASQQAAARPAAVRTATQQAAPAAAGAEIQSHRVAKKAVDDRVDPRMQVNDVGSGTHFARKPLGPGAYFDDGNRAAVHKYYASKPPKPAARAPAWQIGQPLPPGVQVSSLPKPLLSSLPKVPPGHQYVQLGGDVLLVAGSGMVVDAIAAR